MKKEKIKKKYIFILGIILIIGISFMAYKSNQKDEKKAGDDSPAAYEELKKLMPESNDTGTKETPDATRAPLSNAELTKVPEITDKTAEMTNVPEKPPTVTNDRATEKEEICFHKNIEEISVTTQSIYAVNNGEINGQAGIPFEEINVVGYHCKDCGKDFYFD